MILNCLINSFFTYILNSHPSLLFNDKKLPFDNKRLLLFVRRLLLIVRRLLLIARRLLLFVRSLLLTVRNQQFSGVKSAESVTCFCLPYTHNPQKFF